MLTSKVIFFFFFHSAKAVQRAKSDSASLSFDELHTKYLALVKECHQIRAKTAQLAKERDAQKHEHARMVAQKARLETLCRDLNKTTKSLAAEVSLLKAAKQNDTVAQQYESSIWHLRSSLEQEMAERKKVVDELEM
jgi:septal ring factor EnvC (AmiA/AmiB activator)